MRLDEAAAGADVLVVQGGINDIAQGRPVEEAAANLREMVRRGKELGLRVALADVLPWNNGWPDAEPKIRRLNALIVRDRAGGGRDAAAVPRHARGSGTARAHARGLDALGRRPPVRGRLPPARRGRLQASGALDVEDVAVAGALEAVVERQLVRAVDDHEPLRTGALERVDRLHGGEVAAQLALRGSASVASQRKRSASRATSTSCVARRGVAGVRERPLAVADAKAVRLEP